jgi:hypothetical protein
MSQIAAPTLLPVFRWWVIGLVALVAISPTDIPASYRLYLALVYLLLFAYPIVNRRYDGMEAARAIIYTPLRFGWAVPLLLFQLMAVWIATQYYTGTNYPTALLAALSGENTYGAYQAYFAEARIAFTSPWQRAGYAILLAAAKLIFVFSVVNFYFGRERRAGGAAFMALSCGLYLGFGLARGTFFEVFEVTCAVVYFWVMTSVTRHLHMPRRRKRVLYLLGVMAVLLIGLFILNAMRRYEDVSAFFRQCSSNFCYNPVGISDFIEFPIYLLTVYFGNAGVFMASLLDVTLTRGVHGYLLPMQSVLANWGGDEFGLRAVMCERYVVCRFVWTPEVATVLSIFGILAIPITNMLVVQLGRFESFVIRNASLSGMMLLYFAFVFCISLPTANFFTISSPSIIATVALTVVFLSNRRRLEFPQAA